MRRRERWEHREELKDSANRRGSLADTHPQARRAIEEATSQVIEWREDCDITVDGRTKVELVEAGVIKVEALVSMEGDGDE